MRQNSLKSYMVLSTALALLFTVMPIANATDVKEDEEQTLTTSQPVPDVFQNQDTVTVECQGWFSRTTQIKIPRSQYEDREDFERKYPGYYLVKEQPTIVEKQQEETVKIQHKGWLKTTVLDILKSEYENTEHFAQKYPGYTLLGVKEETPLVQENSKSKTTVNAQDVRKALQGVEGDLTMSHIVSLVQQTKEKDEAGQKTLITTPSEKVEKSEEQKIEEEKQ